MNLVGSATATRYVQQHGGALYVWPRKAGCCGGLVTLEASTERPQREFRLVSAHEFELFLPVGMREPESLHLELSRRGRMRAFWNGLAWVC